MPDHPLAEVFGFPTDNVSEEASRYRKGRLCPYNNKVPNCTKDKANNPLGVCSIFVADENVTITCPIRFRQDWLIADDAAAFFFPADANWTSLTEVRLNDSQGRSAGNIDIVLVAYDELGHILDFGSLEVQAVYISGNIRRPFEHYMEDPASRPTMDWRGQPNYPRPDYLSSSRKRLVPQLIYKGSILKSWGKKQAAAVHRTFYSTLPPLTEVDPRHADMAWLVYDLVLDAEQNRYQLGLHRTIYTMFEPALDEIITPPSGPIDDFTETLQDKLNKKLEDDENSSEAPTLDELL